MTTREPTGTAEYVFLLPDLGEGLVSAEIIEWLAGAGDTVELDQPVVVVETAKSTVELPSPYRGRITELHAEVTETIAVGAPLVSLSGPDGQAAAGGTTHLVGQVTAAAAGPAAAPARRLPAKRPDRGQVVASPVVRRLARELGVDLRGITGTGEGGVVTKDDVRAAAGVTGPG